MRRLRRYRTDLLITAALLILPLLLFGEVSLGGRTMLPADNLFQWRPWASAADDFGVEQPHNALLSDLILENYVWKTFIADSLSSAELPLWNPYIFAGTPFLAAGQHSAYYPFSALFLVLPLSKAYGWFTISQLWLAGLLTYFFGRVMGMRKGSAALSGLVYQGSGFLLVSSAVFPMILAAAVWLPLVLGCLEMILRHATSRRGAGRVFTWSAAGSIGLGLQLLAGHIEITYYTLLVMALFALWRLITYVRRNQPIDAGVWTWLLSFARPLGWLLITVMIGLALGAIQFIPFLEVAQSNFREGAASLAEVRSWAFPPRRILTLAMPDFFGNPADHEYLDVFTGQHRPFETNMAGELNPHGAYSSNWGIKNYVEGGIYLGIIPLLAALLALWSAWRHRPDRRSEIGFFASLSLLSLSFIFGTPTYAILYYGLPGINQLHSPFRWVFPFSLCIAMLTGFGWDYVASRRDARALSRSTNGTGRSLLRSLVLLGARPSTTAIMAAAAVWSGMALLLALLASRLAFDSLEQRVVRVFNGLERATDAFPDHRAFYSFEVEQFFFLAAMLLLGGTVLRLGCSRARFRGKTGWAGVAFIAIGLDLLIAGYGFRAAVDPTLLSYEPALVGWLRQQPGLWRLTTFAPHGDKSLNANTAWMAGFQDVRGYDSIILRQYTDYMAAIEPQDELQFNRVQPVTNWEALTSPLLDLLGVKYVISAEPIELPKLRQAWQGEGLIVYENLAVSPRAFTLPVTATVAAEDPLSAMADFDPRQHVIVHHRDLPESAPPSTRPGQLIPAHISSYSNIEVNVEANVEETSWLVLNDTYFQGWDVFFDRVGEAHEGEEGEVKGDLVRVNGNFRGVLLEPGRWQVRFRYSPLSFKVGGLTSFMGGVIILFGLAVWSWRRFYNPEAPLTNTRSIAKNSLAPMSLNLFNRAIDFAFAAFYLRVLGPADAGKYATAIIIAGWFEIISNWGLNTLIIREVASDRSQASRYLLNTTVLRLGTGLIASVPVLVYLAGIQLAGNPLDSDTALAVFVLMAGMVFSGMSQGLAGLYYAFETAEYPASITTVTTILKVALGVAVLVLGFGFVGLAGVSIVVNLVTLTILTVSAFRHFHLAGPWQVDLGLQKRMLSASYPLMLNHLFAVIFFQIDVPLMRQFNGESTVGWYNSAYKWVNAFNVIPSFFTFALFPVLTRQVQSSLDDARRTFHMSLKLMLLLAFPLASLTTILAPTMIAVLGGGEFLPHGAVALQLVIWSIPIGWMNSVINYVLIALGQERKLTWAFVAGVAFNLVANLIFLPRYSYLAASVITILSELILLILFAIFLRRAMPGFSWTKLVTRPLALCSLIIWAVVLGAQVSLIAALLAGLLSFPLGLWIFRLVGEEEKRIFLTLLPDQISNRFSTT